MTQLPEFLIKIIGIVLGKTFILYFLLFILVSYLLLALLTWSFIKPLKYLGIPFIVVGILTLIARFVLPIILKSVVSVPANIVTFLLNPFLKIGIICLVSGVLAIIVYKLLNKFLLNKKMNTIVNEVGNESDNIEKASVETKTNSN